MSRHLIRDIPAELFHAQIRIRAPLRCDGVGSLDAAEDIATGARLAVRWLPLEAQGELAVEEILLLPPHPNLPRVAQSGKLGHRAFVALDFPEGQLLSQVLGRPLAPERIAQVGLLMAEALAALHEKGILHGQVCGESILLTGDNKALLWDFPLVLADRLTDRRGEQRLISLLPRTCAYMSPQLAQGRAASEASDIYSLGIALCLAAGAPFPEGTPLEILYRVANFKWRPQPTPHVPPGLSDLLLQMTHPDESLRPSADAVRQGLRPYCVVTPHVPKVATVAPSALSPSAFASLAATPADVGFDFLVLSDLPPFGVQTGLSEASSQTPLDFVLASTHLTWDARAKEEKKPEALTLPPLSYEAKDTKEDGLTLEEETHTSQTEEIPEFREESVAPPVAMPSWLLRHRKTLLAGVATSVVVVMLLSWRALSTDTSTPQVVEPTAAETEPSKPKVKLPDFNYDDPPAPAKASKPATATKAAVRSQPSKPKAKPAPPPKPAAKAAAPPVKTLPDKLKSLPASPRDSKNTGTTKSTAAEFDELDL